MPSIRKHLLLVLATLSYACYAHMTNGCLSRLENGNLRLTVQHWHSGNPAPDSVTTWTLSSASASDTGLFDDFVSGCGALCPTSCTETATCGASIATEGAWYVEIDDTPPRFTPGETAYYTVINGGATMAPTGTCDTIGFNGYGLDEGSGEFITVPPPLSTCFADICGDGAAAPVGEDCDGSDLKGADCASIGFDGGSLSCGTCCTYDVSGCFFCNDFANSPTLVDCRPATTELVAEPGLCCAYDSFAVTVTDADQVITNCPAPSLSRTMGLPSGSCFFDGDIVQYTATDSANQQDQCTWTYRVYDQQPPVYTSCPAGASFFVGEPISFGAISASDNCAGVSSAQLSGPAPGDQIYTPGQYPVVWEATDSSGLTAYCLFSVTVSSPVRMVYQEDETRIPMIPPNADPSTAASASPLILYMYLPITVSFADMHQAGFGYGPEDGARDFFQLREQGSSAVVFTSEMSPNLSTTTAQYEERFGGMHSVAPGSNYEFWSCMSGSSGTSCARVYVKVSVCPSPYTPDPPECVISPL